MSTFNVEQQWILLDGCGDTLGIYNDRPDEDAIRRTIEPRLEDTVGPFILVEAFRREVWDAGCPDYDLYRINMTAPPAPAATPVQSGPRKVIIR